MSIANLPDKLSKADFTIADPGASGAIRNDQYGVVGIVTAGAETRTLAIPTRAGIRLTLNMITDGGDCVVTVASAYDETGGTTLTFSDPGQYVDLLSIRTAAGTYAWRVVAFDGVTGPTTTLSSATVASLTATSATIPTLAINTVTTAAETAEHGAGAIGTGVAPVTYRRSENGIIITEIKVDLEGLASVATANDVIGLAAGGNAYIGRNVVATNGIIYKIEQICVETPAGGDNDVNIVANSSGTLAYDGAGGTTYGVNAGDAVAGQVVQNLVQGLTANHYFYLTAGTGDTAATYTAGQFIFRLYGHAVLA